MFDDILGEHKEKIINDGSTGDTKPTSFNDIWRIKQLEIDNHYMNNSDEENDDDYDDEYDDVHLSGFVVY